MALSKELDEAGYTIRPAAVRVSDLRLTALLTGMLALGMTCGYLFFGSFQMDWQPNHTVHSPRPSR